MFSRHVVTNYTRLLIRPSLRSITTSPVCRLARKKADEHDATEPLITTKKRVPRKPTKADGDAPETTVLVGLQEKQAKIEASVRRRASLARTKEAKAAGIEPADTKATTKKRAKSKSENASLQETSLAGTKPTARERAKPKSVEAPPELLVQGSNNHHDLATFLAFAKKNELKTTSKVYNGTLYEYTVADVLKGFGFALHRTGRANDLGIDLLGHWHLPDGKQELKVLLQCKAGKSGIGPRNLRELMGAYGGAPLGWQGSNVLALLVSTQPSTKGVIAAVQRCTSPVGVMQIDGDGYIRQFLWNAVAGERGLAGLGVTTRFIEGDASVGAPRKVKKELVGTIALTWLGEPWRKAPTAPVKALAEAVV